MDRITKHSTENSTNTNDLIYNPGDVYLNPDDIFPMDSISVGFTRWHLDYSIISFYPIKIKMDKPFGKDNITMI